VGGVFEVQGRFVRYLLGVHEDVEAFSEAGFASYGGVKGHFIAGFDFSVCICFHVIGVTDPH
jgi:hypothetical protein